MATFQIKRVAAGHYRSLDGRVEIARVVSQTYHADELCWEVRVDGRVLPFAYDTKREAVIAADRQLLKNDEQRIIDFARKL